MKKWLLPILLGMCTFGTAHGQGEIDTENKILYRNEWSISFKLKSNGVESDFRSGKFVNAFKKNLWDVGFSTIKHPQEYRDMNQYVTGYGSFTFGKDKTCFDLFASIGKQRSLCQKQDKGSVEIRAIYFAGASLAFLKPIYYEIWYAQDDIRSERFDPINHYAATTLGRSSFIKGFDDLQLVPGIYTKAAISFEFGKSDKKLSALEAGVKLSAYAKKLEIMAQERNFQFLCNVFISFRLGKVKHGAQYEYLNDYEGY